MTFARSLPETRLVKLSQDLQRLAPTSEARHGWPIHDGFPIELADLKPHSAKSQGDEFEVVLKHCGDHRVVLASPIGGQEQRITLSWGEGPTFGQQVLWHQPEP
ncbi:hypothetical protein GCM10027430_29050 [Lysobacter tyrosinilyticus]